MKRILLVEPDRLLAKTYQQTLQRAGYEVFWETTAQAGIHTLDTRAIDLVILELQIARHNGVEFLYELRSYTDWLDIPVIIQSHVNPTIMDNQVLRERLGVRYYLHKPKAKLADLLMAVNQVMQPA